MADSLYRQWQIIQMIPRAPRGITINQIISRLRDSQPKAPTYRTIDRDLKALSRVFPIRSELRGKAFHWYTDENTVLEIPSMDSSTALAFCIAEQQLNAQMPPSALDHLQAHFNTAEKILNRQNSAYSKWREKIRVLPQTQQLIAPEIDAEISNTVYTALLENRRFMGKYFPRHADQYKHYPINPIALIFRGTVTYLVCTLRDYTDVRLLDLHRLVEAEMVEQASWIPENFDLDTYINTGHIDFLMGGNLELELLIDEEVAIHLRESKLTENQQLISADDEKSVFKATVKDTGQLRWWLLGFADQIEVLKPESLRQEFKEKTARMKSRYGD